MPQVWRIPPLLGQPSIRRRPFKPLAVSTNFHDEPNKLIRVKGIGLIDLMLCPHYDVEKDRQPSLKKMVALRGHTAIALTNCCALEVVDDSYRLLTSSTGAKAYKLYRRGTKVIEEKLPIVSAFRPLSELLLK